MAINFDSFTEGTTQTIQSDDYVVGFDTAVPGGERKWTISTLANAVSGLITPQLYNQTSFSKVYDTYYYRSGTFTWVAAALGSNPKNAAWNYSWPSNGFATVKYNTNIVPLSSDSFYLENDSSIFLTHNLYYNYNGATGIVAAFNSYDYSTDGGSTWINSLSANIVGVKIFRQIPSSGDMFDNSGASGTGTCILTAAKGMSLKFRPNMQLATNTSPNLTNIAIYGSQAITIQKI